MKKEFSITPWKVEGDINYQELIKKFGLQPLEDLPEIFKKNQLFRRKIIFAHRDFGRIVSAVQNKKKFVVMTGLMPTGKFHLGHAVLVNQMVFYQSLGAKIFIAVADLEAYNFRGQSLEESKKIALKEYIPNYIALGLKPKNVEIYFQSARSKDGKKSNAYYSLQNLLAKHVTLNEFKAIYGEISPGKMLSALLQASDMLHPQLEEFKSNCPVVIPVGSDQDPHIRLARDISQRIKKPKFLQFSSTYHFFAPGLKGGKMSASDPLSYIAMTDSPKEIENKIKKYAFSGGQKTIKEHRAKGGNPSVDVSFQYLKFFFEIDDKKLAQIEEDYKSGKLLSEELKKIAIEKINTFLEEHQAKMKKVDLEKFIN